MIIRITHHNGHRVVSKTFIEHDIDILYGIMALSQRLAMRHFLAGTASNAVYYFFFGRFRCQPVVSSGHGYVY